MAVKGSTAKGVGKKVKPAPKAKSAFKYYEPKAQGGAAEAGVKNPKSIRGAKDILRLYKAGKTGSIAPNQITKLKQQRANEASQARRKAYQGAKVLSKPKKGERRSVKPLSEAAIKSAQVRSKRPMSLVSTGERAPKVGIGKYRTVQPAPASPRGRKDYRKDFNTVAATEKRNASIHYMRQAAARKKRG
jgi:hypothetical protein